MVGVYPFQILFSFFFFFFLMIFLSVYPQSFVSLPTLLLCPLNTYCFWLVHFDWLSSFPFFFLSFLVFFFFTRSVLVFTINFPGDTTGGKGLEGGCVDFLHLFSGALEADGIVSGEFGGRFDYLAH